MPHFAFTFYKYNAQVIFYEQDWNPQVDKQALQRAHRIGQMNHVLSINLVTRHTVEEVRYCILPNNILLMSFTSLIDSSNLWL